MFRVVVLGLVLASCYTYGVAPCTVRCAIGHECPASFSCAEDKFCHAAADEAACPCMPLTCNDVPGACDDMDDTCGGTIHCPSCALPETCGGAGTPNVCGDPKDCVPEACTADQCGAITDTCGNPATCPNCGSGMKCNASHTCEPCTPHCQMGELACGDDSCGGSCGSCPDSRWTCHAPGICCIKDGEQCDPFNEGCNCCPGLFCESGFCTPAAGCALAPNFTP